MNRAWLWRTNLGSSTMRSRQDGHTMRFRFLPRSRSAPYQVQAAGANLTTARSTSIASRGPQQAAELSQQPAAQPAQTAQPQRQIQPQQHNSSPWQRPNQRQAIRGFHVQHTQIQNQGQPTTQGHLQHATQKSRQSFRQYRHGQMLDTLGGGSHKRATLENNPGQRPPKKRRESGPVECTVERTVERKWDRHVQSNHGKHLVFSSLSVPLH
ncbi:MAG: hypothetical protein J3Q66DRAFT_339444 [Benniella sp.]|nr:MAG: hypothetical protein J3Q66DRAFT_339444 [Benniella sp.]